MLRGQPLIAIIPVRGGSKGIPGKNMLRFGRYTLLERAIRLGLHSPWVDRVVVSTDDPDMYRLAEHYDVAAPTLRPDFLAADDATTSAVVEFLIEQMEIPPSYLLLLQASSPLRTLADLNGLCHLFSASEADAVVSLCRIDDPHPEKIQTIENGRVRPYMGGEALQRPRQLLKSSYALNGAFYLIDRDAFLEQKSFLPPETLPYIMPPERSHNLDSKTDLQILTAMLKMGYWTLEDLD